MRVVIFVVGALSLLACSSAPLDAEPGPEGAGGGGGSGAIVAGAGTGAVPAADPGYRRQDYPAGPYGLAEGATLENLGFLGWRDPVAAGYDVTKLEPVYLADFYDPDGTSGRRYLWINASAVWCTVCQAEMRDIKNNSVNAIFGAKGVQLIGTLFEDNSTGPAKPADLKRWGELPTHGIDFPLLLDPGFKLGAYFTSDATPLNLLVDARTMRIVNATMGYSTDYWERIDALLAKAP